MNTQLSDRARFEYALDIILRHEGKFSDETHDKGGASNYGISLRYLRLKELDLNKDGIIDERDIYTVDKDIATFIYKRDWWDRYKYNKIRDLRLAGKLMDLSIWMGANQAHKILQMSLNRLGQNISVDGVLGSETFNAIDDFEIVGNSDQLLKEIRDNSVYFIINLVASNPDLTKFKRGWLLRAGK